MKWWVSKSSASRLKARPRKNSLLVDFDINGLEIVIVDLVLALGACPRMSASRAVECWWFAPT